MADENLMNEAPMVPPHEELTDPGFTHSQKGAEDVGSAAGAIGETNQEKAEQTWEDAKDRVRTFRRDADQYVRENPTKAVFTMLGIGFVLGLIFRR